jgi:predicted nuclease of predicted toxin-antitoxin system
MKLLLDMNLSPTWVRFLEERGFETVHWSAAGDPTATDAAIMAWARDHGFIVITHDLDFSAILAHSAAAGPSVIQVRTQDVLPEAIGADLVRVLRQHRAALEQGAAGPAGQPELLGQGLDLLPRAPTRLTGRWVVAPGKVGERVGVEQVQPDRTAVFAARARDEPEWCPQ